MIVGLGYADVTVEDGAIFGKDNQICAYQLNSYKPDELYRVHQYPLYGFERAERGA